LLESFWFSAESFVAQSISPRKKESKLKNAYLLLRLLANSSDLSTFAAPNWESTRDLYQPA
jgi:hypothetical protein